MAKRQPKGMEKDKDAVRIREELDFPQLVFLAIKNIIVAPDPTMYLLRVSHLESLLWYYKDKHYKRDKKQAHDDFESGMKGLSSRNWRDRIRMQNLEIVRAQNIFRGLVGMCDRLGLLGEKEIEEEI